MQRSEGSARSREDKVRELLRAKRESEAVSSASPAPHRPAVPAASGEPQRDGSRYARVQQLLKQRRELRARSGGEDAAALPSEEEPADGVDGATELLPAQRQPEEEERECGGQDVDEAVLRRAFGGLVQPMMMNEVNMLAGHATAAATSSSSGPRAAVKKQQQRISAAQPLTSAGPAQGVPSPGMSRAATAAAVASAPSSSAAATTTAVTQPGSYDSMTEKQRVAAVQSRMPPALMMMIDQEEGPVDISMLWGAPSGDATEESESGYTASIADTASTADQPPRDGVSTRPRPSTGRAPAARQAAAVRPSSGGAVRASRPSSGRPISSGGGGQSAAGAAAAGFLPDDCTFQPKLNARSRAMAAARGYPRQADARLEQLSRPRSVPADKLAARREELDAELAECTFAPVVNRGLPPSVGGVRSRPDEPVHDRLYNLGQQLAWQAKKAALAEERERDEAEQCTFRPATNAARRPPPPERSAPLHQRLADELRRRSERLSAARLKAEAEESGSFRPAINHHSVRLVLAKEAKQALVGSDGDSGGGGGQQADPATVAGERLYRKAAELASAKAARSAELDPASAASCTFAPAITDHSRQLLAASCHLPEDFLARQRYLACLVEDKKRAVKELVEAAEGRYQPMTLSRSLGADTLAAAAAGDNDGDGIDRFEKLAADDPKAKAAALAEHYYAQFSFTPAINPRSRHLVAGHSIDELYANAKGAAVRDRVAKVVEERFEKECTFAPAINNSGKYANVRGVALRMAAAASSSDDSRSATGSAASSSDAIAGVSGSRPTSAARRAQYAEQAALREYREMLECTFAPEVNRQAPDFSRPVAVPGLGRYLELQQAARKKREEQAALEAAIFLENCEGPKQLFTVPQPFQLSAPPKKWQQQQAEAKARRRASSQGDAGAGVRDTRSAAGGGGAAGELLYGAPREMAARQVLAQVDNNM